jgi:hypothetical protein
MPIYRQDTGPTDFHLHLPPAGFQFVLVTSGVFPRPGPHPLHSIHRGTLTILVHLPNTTMSGEDLTCDQCIHHGALVIKLLKPLGSAVLGPGLLPLGGVGDDLQFAEMALNALLGCGDLARYPEMLRSASAYSHRTIKPKSG